MNATAWSSVTEARGSLPEFVLPAAYALDIRTLPNRQVAAPDWHTMHRLLRRGATERAARTELIDRVGLANEPWPAGVVDAAVPADAIDTPQTHDDYFRIGRSAGEATAGYIGGIGRALALFLDEVHASGELHEYRGIGEALLCLWEQAWPGEAPARHAPLAELARHTDLAAVPLLQRAPAPLRRWLRGHQIFAVLTQGMVWTLEHLSPALAEGDDATAEQVLCALAALYRASAAAFRFTADFDPLIYAVVLRPTMCEPYMPKGFSGTLSSDHGHLVARLTALRDALAAAQRRWPAAYAQMRDALGAVYDNHRWVCERFDGANVPSLRTSSVSGETAAVEMLDRFRARRLEMLR